MQIRFEPRDLWIGLYWNSGTFGASNQFTRIDVYICIVPLFPIHLKFDYRNS
jgi:hypothetical protein